jgi:virginiamycin B lyase
VFKAQRFDGGKGAAKGLVKVDVSSLAEDFGGEYMARLQVVRFRACALTTPTPVCQRLVRRSRAGFSPSQSAVPGFIASTTSASRDVFVNATHIFWTNLNTGTIGRANIDGTGVNQSFITGIDAPSGITSDGSFLYWTTGGNNNTLGSGGIARAGMDGVTGRNNAFIAGASKPLAVAVDGTYVYWANFNSTTIGRALKTGASVNQAFMTVGAYPYGVEVRGAFIYWSIYQVGTVAGTKIGRADVGGTNINSNFISTANGPTGLASDGTYLYWSNYESSTIGRSLLDGSQVNQVYVSSLSGSVADKFNPVGVAVTSGQVLWTNFDSLKVGRASFAGTTDQLTVFLDGQEVVNNPGSATVTSAARYYSGSGLLATRTMVGGLTYVGTDSQGTLTATLTTAGVSTRQLYKPFGEQRGSASQQSVLPSERGFIGQVEDTATGLSYLNARHYDAKNATFISVDPVLRPHVPESLNAYNYAGNNPVLFSDPTGLEKGANGEAQAACRQKQDCMQKQKPGTNDFGDSEWLSNYYKTTIPAGSQWASCERNNTGNCGAPPTNAEYSNRADFEAAVEYLGTVGGSASDAAGAAADKLTTSIAAYQKANGRWVVAHSRYSEGFGDLRNVMSAGRLSVTVKRAGNAFLALQVGLTAKASWDEFGDAPGVFRIGYTIGETAAVVGGGALGARGGATLGGIAGAPFGGIGAPVGAAIGAVVGGIVGAVAADHATDWIVERVG